MDWKNFYIQNPWIPTSVLMEKFGIKRYDISNWLKSNPNVRVVLNRDKWKLTENQSPDDCYLTLNQSWEYYLKEVKKLDFSNDNIVSELINLKTPKSPWSFLVDRKHLKKINEYTEWTNVYSRISFVISKIYPGEEFCKERGLLPQLFKNSGTNSKNIDVLGLLEHVYLKFYSNLTGEFTQNDVDNWKRVFIGRYNETGFFTMGFLLEHGVSSLLFDVYTKNSYTSQLCDKFIEDLGIEFENKNQGLWNSGTFRKSNLDINTTECKWCSRKPVDLHHLLPRNERPDLTYNSKNVVPLCTLVHSYITREMWDENSKSDYNQCKRKWDSLDENSKESVFDDVMNEIHDIIYMI